MNITSKYIKYILFAFFSGVILAGCLKKENYPLEPHIEFESFDITYDYSGDTTSTAELTLRFTDGDGNIGLNQADTLGDYCSDTCLFHYNLFCEYYEKFNGEWIHYPIDYQAGFIPFYYRIPDLTPAGQNPSLSGEIVLDMPTYFMIFTPGDTARFEVSIVDQDFNVSNTITTNEFIKGS